MGALFSSLLEREEPALWPARGGNEAADVVGSAGKLADGPSANMALECDFEKVLILRAMELGQTG